MSRLPGQVRPLAQRGFTLVELTASSLVSVTVIGVMWTLVNTASHAISTMQGLGTVQLQLTQALTALNQDARLTIAAPTTCCGGAYTQNPGNSAGATWIFQVPPINANGAVISGSDFIIYRFDAATGSLQRIVDGDETAGGGAGSARLDSTAVIARNLSSMTFALNANELSVTVQSTTTEAIAGILRDGVASDFVFRNAK